MIGASLSRWTLAYLGSALFWFVAAQTLIVLGVGYPRAAIDAPETLIVVHMFAVGWLSLLVCGALLQFVPVLTASPLKGEQLAPLALILLTAGLLLLLLGFAGLGGFAPAPALILPAGGLLLLAGFSCLAIALARTLWAARPLPLPARFVAVGIACLIATALLGNVFALVLSGVAGGEAAFAVLLHGVPLHAVFGLGGWLSLTAIGVSYRLFAMFLLASDPDVRSMRLVLIAGLLALAPIAAGVPFIIAVDGGAPFMLAAAAIAGLSVVSLYTRDVIVLYRARKRRVIELNMKAAFAALGCLVSSCIALVVLLAVGQLEAHIGALVYLFAFGWLGGLGLAKLYKIVPFVTWLECFAPRLGKAPTPRVQDLVDERQAAVWFVLFYAGVLTATGMLAVGWAEAFRICVFIQLAGSLGLIRHFYRARVLRNVPGTVRYEAHPRLFLANVTSRSMT